MAADRAGQLEDAHVLTEIDKALGDHINGLKDRGHFDAVQVAPGNSSDVPDEPGGVRAVILGVTHGHAGRDGSDALTEAGDILMQRGNKPRVYRNMLVFLGGGSAAVGQFERCNAFCARMGRDCARHRAP